MKTGPIKLHAKVVFEWDYSANPKYYGTDNPKKIAKIDLVNVAEDIFLFIDQCPNEPKITISPVKEE